MFYIYGNYNDVANLAVYSLLQQNSEIREHRKITVLDVVTLFTFFAQQTPFPDIYLVCPFRLQTSLGWAEIFCHFESRNM